MFYKEVRKIASVKDIDENTFQVVVSLGYRIDGTKKRKKRTFYLDPHLTKKQKEKEKERLVYEYEKEVKNHAYLETDIKFVDYSKIFMEEAKENLSITTYQRYKTLLERINLEIGELKLSQIKSPHIKEFKKKIAKITRKVPIKDENDKVTGHKDVPLAPKTQLHYFRLLSSILSSAVHDDYIATNPCSNVNAPIVPKKEAPFLDIEEIKNMLKLLENEPIQYKSMITLLVYTGLRRR